MRAAGKAARVALEVAVVLATWVILACAWVIVDKGNLLGGGP